MGIFGDAVFTRKPTAHQNGKRGTVTVSRACTYIDTNVGYFVQAWKFNFEMLKGQGHLLFAEGTSIGKS